MPFDLAFRHYQATVDRFPQIHEIAILERNGDRRCFRRLEASEVEAALRMTVDAIDRPQQ